MIPALVLMMSTSAGAEIKIALSTSTDMESSGTAVWASAFANELAQQGIETRIFPSSTLGNEILRTEQVLRGLLEVNVIGLQEVAMFSPLMLAFGLPFMFTSTEEVFALLDVTDFLDRLNAATLPKGVRVIDFAFLGGSSGLFTARHAVRDIEDMSALRLRAMTADQLDWIEALGGAGTQVAWEEVPQALQTGIADGYFNPPIVAVLFGHGGQLDYFTDLRSGPSLRLVVVSERWYSRLSDEERGIMRVAFRQARQANREWTIAAQQSELQQVQQVGIEVIELSEEKRGKFRDRSIGTWPEQVDGDVLEEILAYTRKVRGQQ